jgi:hypothetical protein
VDARHDALDRRVLEQVAAGSGDDRVHHVRVLVRDGEDDHAGQRRLGGDVPGRLDPAHLRHVQIHDDDVRSCLPNEPYCLEAVGRLAEHLDARLLLEQVPEARPEEIVVVDEDDAYVVPRTVPIVVADHDPPRGTAES